MSSIPGFHAHRAGRIQPGSDLALRSTHSQRPVIGGWKAYQQRDYCTEREKQRADVTSVRDLPLALLRLSEGCCPCSTPVSMPSVVTSGIGGVLGPPSASMSSTGGFSALQSPLQGALSSPSATNRHDATPSLHVHPQSAFTHCRDWFAAFHTPHDELPRRFQVWYDHWKVRSDHRKIRSQWQYAWAEKRQGPFLHSNEPSHKILTHHTHLVALNERLEGGTR